MKTSVKFLVVALLVAAGLTACGGGGQLAYAPVAYGQNNQCYYLDDPAEAISLQQAGFCGPTGNYWVPTLMPLFWHTMYYPYYSSPAYYGTYVVASHRTVYVSTQKTFETQHSSEIKTASAKAKYKGSDGKTYTGNKVKKGSFSNGKKGFGSGKKCGLPQGDASSLTGGAYSKGTTGGGRSSGSTGGSRPRSGTTGGGSKPRTNTNKSGC